ncbi:hypothetical protein SK128_001569 [Halocaridina rubra]|uniref:Ig-like domain-containing protein n=1 Tax=Halocaridina rubra TaxID=373956 RepID=A0AAN9A8M0_HALRR
MGLRTGEEVCDRTAQPRFHLYSSSERPGKENQHVVNKREFYRKGMQLFLSICLEPLSRLIRYCTLSLLNQELPSVLPGEEEIIGIAGQRVKLTCRVTGYPQPAVTWARPDQARTPVKTEHPRIQIIGNTLVISPVVVEDMGKYECTAHNPAGKSSAEMLLTVHCKYLLKC